MEAILKHKKHEYFNNRQIEFEMDENETSTKKNDTILDRQLSMPATLF